MYVCRQLSTVAYQECPKKPVPECGNGKVDMLMLMLMLLFRGAIFILPM
jgi:hypothetical protein